MLNSPEKYITMTNNEGNTPIQNILLKLEKQSQYSAYGSSDKSFIKSFESIGQAYKQYGNSLASVKLPGNQNLLHKSLQLKKTFLIPVLLGFGVGVNDIDDDGKTPIFYYLQCPDISTYDLTTILNGMDKNLLNHKDSREYTALSYYVEGSFPRSYSYHTEFDKFFKHLKVLIDSGMDIHIAAKSLDGQFFEKDNLKHNKIILAMCWEFVGMLSPFTRTPHTENLNILETDDQEKESILTSPVKVKDCDISLLAFILVRTQQTRTVFHGTKPEINPKLLENIIQIGKEPMDVLYFSIKSNYSSDKMLGLLDIDIWDTNKYDRILEKFGEYRHTSPEHGPMNIVQTCLMIGNVSFFRFIRNCYSSKGQSIPQSFLTEKTQLGMDAYDFLMTNGNYSQLQDIIGIHPKGSHLKLAFDHHQYNCCYDLLHENMELLHSSHLTLGEIVTILVARTELYESQQNQDEDAVIQNQYFIIEVLEKYLLKHPEQEKWEIFSLPIEFKQPVKKNCTLQRNTDPWEAAVTDIVTKMNIFKPASYVSKKGSLFESCYKKGLVILANYMYLGAAKKNKQLLMSKNVTVPDGLWDWCTRRDERGATLLHYACEADYANETLVLDLLKYYTKKVDKIEELLAIKDDNGETPLFYACRNHTFIGDYLVASDTSLKNNDGKTAYHLLTDHEKLKYKKFFSKSDTEPEEQMDESQ